MAFEYLDDLGDSYKVKTDSGQEINVAKSGLDSKNLALLESQKAMKSSSPVEAVDASVTPEPTIEPSRGLASVTPGINTAPAPEAPTQVSLGLQDMANLGKEVRPKVSKADLVPPPVTPSASGYTGSTMNSIKGIEHGFQETAKGIAGEYAAAGRAEVEKAKQLGVLNDELAKQKAKADLREVDRQRSIDEMRQKYDVVAADVKANSQIDPNRYWASKSTGAKIGAAISIALGAIGAGLQGRGDNAALGIIKDAIDKDIDAQKANIAAKREGLAETQTMYSMMRQQFSDERQAEQATRAIAIDNAIHKIDQIMSQFKSPEMAAKAQQLRGQLEVESNKIKIPLIKEAEANATLKALSGGQGDGVDINKLSEKDRERYVPGEGLAIDASTAKTIRENQAATKTALDAIQRLRQIRQDYGSETMNRDIVTEAEGLATTLQGTLRTSLVGPGAVSAHEYKLMDKVIPEDVTTWLSSDKKIYSQLNTLERFMKNKLQRDLQAGGVKKDIEEFKGNK